jgi:hypothetical protein
MQNLMVWSRVKTKPKQTQLKPIQSQFRHKTNPNKANFIDKMGSIKANVFKSGWSNQPIEK